MLFQGRKGLVQPKLFGVVGADGTRACDADVFAGRIAETILGIRDFSKLGDFVGGGVRGAEKAAVLPGDGPHRPYADYSAIGCGQETPANLFYELF